jgi:hypothetical protein
MNVITKEQDFEFRRGVMIEKMNIISYYHRTKALISQMDTQIQELSANVSSHRDNNFKNPRDEMIYLHDVKTLTVVKRQRERLAQKLEELQRRIKEDIDLVK